MITLATGFRLDRSADGGRTWKETFVDDGGAPWNYLAYPSQTTGWAQARIPPSSWLWKTTNTGRTWHEVTF